MLAWDEAHLPRSIEGLLQRARPTTKRARLKNTRMIARTSARSGGEALEDHGDSEERKGKMERGDRVLHQARPVVAVEISLLLGYADRGQVEPAHPIYSVDSRCQARAL
jgi:hypothetical protein